MRKAEEAHRRGMVNPLYSTEILMKKRREMADILASGPPLVYAAIKEVARRSEALTFQAATPRITKRQFESGDVLYVSQDQI
jgi:crotonobetainyl-CoA hydratase